MLLKFPKLLRKQYLNYSPLWKAYLQGQVSNPQTYMINTKLFSAYTVSQLINSQLNSQMNMSSKTQQIYDQFNEYYVQIQSLQQERGNVDEPLQRVNQYLQTFKMMRVDGSEYLNQLHRIYKNRKQPPQLQQNKTQQQKQQSSFQLNPGYSRIPSYIHEFVRVSRTVGIDDIDLLILKTIPMKPTYLNALADSKLQWNSDNYLTLKLFRQIVINQIAKGTYDSIAGLKILVNRFVNAVSNVSPYNQPIDIFVSSLNSLISSGKLMNDINVQTMKYLQKINFDQNSPYRMDAEPGRKKANGRSYLQILLHQYLMYMNWLSMKCLYRPASGSFIVNLQQFCEKIHYCDISQLIKAEAKKDKSKSLALPQEIRQLGCLIMRQQLCKLQIITYLYNQITEATGLKTNKLSEFSKQEIGMENIARLRSIKIEKQKLCEKLCDVGIIDKYNRTKNGYNIQNIGLCLGGISYVIAFMNTNKQNSEIKTNIPIKSDIILKISDRYLQQLIKFDVILLNRQQMQETHRVMTMMIQQQSNVSNKIIQYHKKLSKYVETYDEPKNAPSKRTFKSVITSIYESKILWNQLKNVNPIRNIQNYQLSDIEQIRQSLFLLTQKSKSSKKNKTNENSAKKYRTSQQKEKEQNNQSSQGQINIKKNVTANYFFN